MLKSLPLLLLLLTVLFTGCTRGADRPSAEAVGRSIDLAAGYLERVTQDDGSFIYELDVERGESKGGYNIIRHAGTIYAMSEAYARKPEPGLRDAILRATGFLRANLRPAVPLDSMLSLYEPADLAYGSPGEPIARGMRDKEPYTSLGGAGLGLVALASVERLLPGTVPEAELLNVAKFIAFLQRPNGDFVSRFQYGRGRDERWSSLYYPGEAALGMAMLFERTGNEEHLRVAERGLLFLAETRKDLPQKDVPPDHWALIATERILAASKARGVAVDRERILSHALQVTETILAEQVTGGEDTAIIGAFNPDGRTTPAATRIEALNAALGFLDPTTYADLRRRIVPACDLGVAFLMRNQVTQGEWAGAMYGFAARHEDAQRGGARDGDETGSDAAASVQSRRALVRVDFVQHALSAYIGYERAVLSPE